MEPIPSQPVSRPSLLATLDQALAEFDHQQAYSPTPSELYNPFLDREVCTCTRRHILILCVFLLVLIGSVILCLLLA